jgi:phage replication initiation protein
MKLHQRTGNHSTSQAHSKDRAVIDYLSIVFDMEELERLKGLAKVQMQLSGTGSDTPSYLEHYKSLLSVEDVENYDGILAGNIESFVSLLNTRMNKFYYDFKDWESESGEDFNSSEYAFWTITNNHHGRYNYKHSATLRFDDVPVGIVCWGSENFGAMISFTGKVCGSINFKEMRKICDELGYVRISRIDIAHDDFEGRFNVDTCRKMFKNGLFTVTTQPSYNYIESGVLSKSGRLIPCDGRSFYVGKRQSGKMLRCYEKGKQLQDKHNPNWVRWEVEIRNIDRVIPLDALENPFKYFAGCYPALNHFASSQERIKLQVKKIKVSYEHLYKHAKLGYSKLFNFALQVLQKTPEEIFEDLVEGLEIDSFPDRIKRESLVLST